MAQELYWPNDTTFRDAENNEEYDGEGTYEVPDDRVDDFLDRGWRESEEEGDDEEEPDNRAEAAAEGEELERENTEDPVERLLDRNADEAADEIAAGEHDDRLDEIEDQADRVTVENAVDDRRTTLEEGEGADDEGESDEV